MPTIAIFGSFDGLHPGHDYVLHEAKKHGDVTVILARDEVIRRLKQREPYESFARRREAVQAHAAVSCVRSSDAQEGEYRSILEEQPDIVGFGYDHGVTFVEEDEEDQETQHDEINCAESF